MLIIAFNETSKIIARYNKIEHNLYADDLIIYSKITDLNILKNIYLNILDDLTTWGIGSGANISFDKCKTFHICKKTSCANFNMSFRKINLENTKILRSLVVLFDKKYAVV